MCRTTISALVHFFFFFTDTPPTAIYTLSLHDALPIYDSLSNRGFVKWYFQTGGEIFERIRSNPGSSGCARSEEHTSELQSRFDLVCRLLLEKKKIQDHQ